MSCGNVTDVKFVAWLPSVNHSHLNATLEKEIQSGEPDEEITVEEVLENLEFGLWTAVVLIPILYYINGPSVSNDQWYMRAALCVIAYLGAPITSWIRRSSLGSTRLEPPENGHTESSTEVNE